MSGAPGRVVAVTGAFGALGCVVAQAFARRGDRVCAIDVASEPPAALADALAARGRIAGGTDLQSAAHAQRVLGEAAARLGGLDVLVNVAGGFAFEPFEGGRIETWDAMLSVNLRTAVVATHAALPLMRARRDRVARIVFVSATAALKGARGMAAYSASKAGLLRLTESLAEELDDGTVTVNAVLPSIIDTPANRRAMPDADVSRWVAPESIAEVVAFLASDAAAQVSGACVPVSGVRAARG